MNLQPPNSGGASAPTQSANINPMHLAVILVMFAVAIAVMYMYSPPGALVLTLALLFAMFALRHTELFILAIFFLMPFPISIFGGESAVNISPSDCIAFIFVLVLPMYVAGGKRFTLGPLTVPLIFVLLIDLLSAIMFFDGASTILTFVRVLVMTLIAVGVFANARISISTMRRCFNSYLIGINGLIVCSLWALARGGIHASEFTLGIHKNALGTIYGSAIVTFSGMLIYGVKDFKTRLWVMATFVLSCVCMMLSLSRGGWIATAVGVLFLLAATRKVRALLAVTFLMVPTIFLVWQRLPSDASEYASNISTKSYNVNARAIAIDMAMQVYESSPVYGVGLGLRKSLEPHNVFVLTMAETGLVGLAGFVLLLASGFYTFLRASQLCKGNPRASEVIAIGSAIFLISIVHGSMDVYWRRGTGFMAWACVGMCVYLIDSAVRKAAAAKPVLGGWVRRIA